MYYFLIFQLLLQVIHPSHFESIELDKPYKSLLINNENTLDSFSEGDRLYDQRGDDGGNVIKAIKLYYRHLNSPTAQNLHRYVQLARMEFYAGHFLEGQDSDRSLEYFQSSLQNAAKAAKFLNDDLNFFPELDGAKGLIYAQAIYVYSMSLSQWARLKGTFVILRKWPEIREINQSLIDNAFGHIDYYGPYRIIGLAHHEMPPIAGGNPAIARDYLKKAFEGTLTEMGFSSHVFNNIAYATRLLKDGNREQACIIINKARFMWERDYQRIAPDRVPESLSEKKILMKMWLKDRCHEFENLAP